MATNVVLLIGRLTRDPELRYIPNSGTAVCNFTLAVDKGLSKEKKEEMEAKNQPVADFIRITVWGKMAENCANYLAKGLLTAVQGRIQTRTYEENGEKRFAVDVVATNVEFLEWKDSKRNNQQQGNQQVQDMGYQPVGNDEIPF